MKTNNKSSKQYIRPRTLRLMTQVSGISLAFRIAKSLRVTFLAAPVSRHLLPVIVFSILGITALLPSLAHAQQVWFSPGDDLEVGGDIAHPEFPKLFDEPSQWPTGLSHINVLQFRTAYVIRKPSESAKYCSYLKAHDTRIAVAMSVMPAETCGEGVEGIMSHRGVNAYSRMIKANAVIDLDYVVMDEPLYFGHDY